MNYSIFIMHGDEEDGVNGGEGLTRDGSGSVSPPILTIFRPVSCFFIASSRNRSRGRVYSRF
jgi:hypothetical protein